jgi:hypothetical protein
MKPLPKTEHSLVLRTDFSDNTAWDAVCTVVREPNEDGFKAYVDCISDRAYAGLTVEQLITLAPKGGDHVFAFIVDHVTLANAERPVLVIDLYTEPGRSFRVIPREMWSVENNLSLANMDFCEFADSVDPDGVFRGFPKT